LLVLPFRLMSLAAVLECSPWKWQPLQVVGVVEEVLWQLAQLEV